MSSETFAPGERVKPTGQTPPARLPAIVWLACVAALGLMALTGFQASEIVRLDKQVRAGHAALLSLQQRVDMADVKISQLDAKDPSYGNAKVIIAWNNVTHSGVISITGLPPAPAGHDYQLWALDPAAPAPINGGLLHATGSMLSQTFTARAVGSNAPGFVISLEPAGGSAKTTGGILFALAPGP